MESSLASNSRPSCFLSRVLRLQTRDNVHILTHLFFLKIYYLCIWVFRLLCISVHHMPSWCPQKSEVRSPGIGVMDDCQLLYGFCELKPGLLQEQQVLLTAEPSLHSSHIFSFKLFPRVRVCARARVCWEMGVGTCIPQHPYSIQRTT